MCPRELKKLFWLRSEISSSHSIKEEEVCGSGPSGVGHQQYLWVILCKTEDKRSMKEAAWPYVQGGREKGESKGYHWSRGYATEEVRGPET